MNLEEARKVYWLKNNHKTLGELLDEGILNQSKLELAAEKVKGETLKIHFPLFITTGKESIAQQVESYQLILTQTE